MDNEITHVTPYGVGALDRQVLTDSTDTHLIETYRLSGEGLGILYSRYRLMVLGTCIKLLKSRSEADDAVQDIYILIGDKLKTHEVGNFKSWLYVVVKNHCYERLRKQSSQREKKNRAEGVYSDAIFHPDNIHDESSIIKLNQCMDALPTHQHSAIKAFYFEKMSYKEIASSYSLSWGKIRSLIQNGRRNLKNCMEAKS